MFDSFIIHTQLKSVDQIFNLTQFFLKFLKLLHRDKGNIKIKHEGTIGFCGLVRKLVTQIGKRVFQISQINCRHELGLSALHLSNSILHFGQRI